MLASKVLVLVVLASATALDLALGSTVRHLDEQHTHALPLMEQTPDVLSWVDPFIGSGGAGFGAGGHNPGAQVPFGILRLGPDTGTLLGKDEIVNPPFDHYGGYHHSDNSVVAFSHTHLVGAGVGDLGNFGVVPTRFPRNGSEAALTKLCAYLRAMTYVPWITIS
jgi:putative alpha-1,2-mannosidase